MPGYFPIDISRTISVDLDFRNPSNVPECPATMITCGTGVCVHSVYTCDRLLDCADGTDERNCLDGRLNICDQIRYKFEYRNTIKAGSWVAGGWNHYSIVSYSDRSNSNM